jgi:PAS domain S-box-containing protein
MSGERRGCHVLIVEDSMTQAVSLDYLLSENGYHTSIATNGLEALQKAQQHKPDLVVSDITMPIMGGFEFCSRAKADAALCDIPILLLTDLSNPDDIIHGLEARADGYITKPYEEGFLLRKIRSLLARPGKSPTADAAEDCQAIEFVFDDKTHIIKASRQHILDMFISTYEHSLAQKRMLQNKQRELNEINAKLTTSLDNLKMSEERFRSLVETVPDIVYRLDSEGRFSFLNNAIERLGYHKGELIGSHFSEIISAAEVGAVSWDTAVPKPGEQAPAVPPKLFDERRSGKRMTAGLEVRLKAKSGAFTEHGEVKSLANSPLVVEINSSGLYGEGAEMQRNYVGTVGVIRDITDRKRVQDALQYERAFLAKLIDTVPLPIFFVDTAGAILLANTAFFRFFAVPASVLGQKWGDFLPQETAARLSSGDDEGNVPEENVPEENVYEATLAAAGGEERTVVVTKIRFSKPGSGVDGRIGLLVDVTERNRTEAELRAAKTRADESTVAKSEFLANMSHEIRTPMNAIIGMAHLALTSELPSRPQDFVRKILHSAQHMLSIINDILDFSKIEAGKLAIEAIALSLDDVFGQIADLVAGKAAAKELELVLDIAPNVPRRLIGDPLRMRQILINLANNAVKFTEAGEIVIRAEVVEETSADVLLRVSVSDTGIGLAAEQKAKLFQSFQQVDASITRRFGGTGLGLAISKRLAELMNGEIGVDSRPGSGSTFWFTVRLGKLAGDTAPAPIEGLAERRVLVVDDNATARALLARRLDWLGFRVDQAASGAEAVGAVARSPSPYEIVYLDLRMPIMDGLATARAIHGLGRGDATGGPAHPAIVLMADYGYEDVGGEGAGADGPDAILIKPVTPSALVATTVRLLGLSAALTGAPLPAGHGVSRDHAIVRGARILLVEDNAINQEVAKGLLEHAGLVVDVADNGAVALGMAAEVDYDMVLMDMQMPVMDGLEATRRLRADPRFADLPIVAMTANAMAGDRTLCLNAGMNDHVGKPFDPEDLLSVIQRWVTGRGEPLLGNSAATTALLGDDVVLPLGVPGLDVRAGLRRLSGLRVLYRELLQSYVDGQHDASGRIRRAIGAGQLTEAEREVHTLKGLAGTIAAKVVQDIAGRIETALRAKAGPDEVGGLLDELDQAQAGLIAAIRNALPQPQVAIPVE